VEEAQVAAGREKLIQHSPIVDAIARAEQGTTGEIRVHLSRSWFERDAYRHAQRLFAQFNMHQTAQRNGVLLYVNLRRHLFAVVGDDGIHQHVGQEYWEMLAGRLAQNLHETHPEKAIALAVLEIGEKLRLHFPSHLDGPNPNELPNVVSED
jgi:uncharacterized membrane protein